MGLGIFRRAFVVRRFGEENIVDGYGVSEYKDFIASLNVQPLNKDELQALPEGENTVKRMDEDQAGHRLHRRRHP